MFALHAMLLATLHAMLLAAWTVNAAVHFAGKFYESPNRRYFCRVFCGRLRRRGICVAARGRAEQDRRAFHS